MYFNVSQLLREPNGARRSYTVDETLTLMSDMGVRRIAGAVTLLRTDQGVWISAVLDTSVMSECSRCLTEYEQSIQLIIEEEYLPVVDITTGARLNRYRDSDETFSIDPNHILDLSEAARQYSELNLPMKPMCRDDCAGICLTCGASLNQTDCSCDKVVRDSRWDPMLELIAGKDQRS